MKKHSNVYPLIFGLILVLVGILTYFTNGDTNIPFIVMGLIFIGISVALFISDKKKKATVAQNQTTVTPNEIKPEENKQDIENYGKFIAKVYLCASHKSIGGQIDYVCIHKETKELSSFSAKVVGGYGYFAQYSFAKQPQRITSYKQLMDCLHSSAKNFFNDLNKNNWESYFHFMLLSPEHSGETLRKQLLSCDTRVVRKAVFAVHDLILKPPKERKEFLTDAHQNIYLIKQNLESLDMGGMFASNSRFNARAVQIIEGNNTDKCFCRLLIDEFGPSANGLAKKGFLLVKGDEEINDYSRRGVIECPICHKQYSIIEEYTGWHIPTTIHCTEISDGIAQAQTSIAQPQTYICARCKKEMTDENSEWIGNHRFCVDCAASPKSTIEKHLEDEAKEAAYQAYMDVQKGALTREQAYSNRGFVKDKYGKWVYKKLLNQSDITIKQTKPEINRNTTDSQNNVSDSGNSIDLDAAIKASRGNNAILNKMTDLIVADCQRYSVPDNHIQALLSEYLNQHLKRGGAEEFIFSYDANGHEYAIYYMERGKGKRIFSSYNPLGFRFLFQLHIVHHLEDDINDDSQTKKLRCEDVMQKLNPEFGETEEYKKTISRFKSTWSDFQTETKTFVKIAEGYDGEFTEYYLELYNENSKFIIRKISHHYNANATKLLKEIYIPESINTQEEIFEFIAENSSSFKFCKVTIDDLLNNKALIEFIQKNSIGDATSERNSV